MMARAFIFAALVLTAPLSYAGYAQLSPPATWGGGPGAWTSSSAANASSFYPNGWRAAGGVINVGGQSVTMQARYTLAANAGRFAAQAIRFNPALAIGGAALTWIATECIEHDGGQWRVTCGPGAPQPSDGREYRHVEGAWPWRATKDLACEDAAAQYSIFRPGQTWVYTGEIVDSNSCLGRNVATGAVARVGNIAWRDSDCPAGWYQTDLGCVQESPGRPATDDDWDRLANQPLPFELPQEIPGPWPVEVPQIDPVRVPVGQPVPVPGSDPQTFTQPNVDIQPAPTPQSPWRVSVQPVDVPVTDPATAPQEPTPLEPETEPGTPRDPDGVCEQYPDALACQKLGMIEAVKLRDDERDLSSIEPDDGWGQGAGACPAPTTITIRGQEISDDWSLMCNFATEIRPIVIGVAWVIAGLTFFGFSRRD